MKKHAFIAVGIVLASLAVACAIYAVYQPDEFVNHELPKSNKGNVSSLQIVQKQHSSRSASQTALGAGQNQAGQETTNSPTYNSATSAAEYLSSAAERFEWSEQQVFTNASLWNSACSEAIKISSVQSDNLSRIGLSDSLVDQARELSNFCINLDLESELAGLDLVEKINEEGIDFDIERERLAQDLRESGATDHASEAAFRLLQASIDRHDEGGVAGMLTAIVHYELFESRALNDPEFQYVYPSIIGDVSLTLLCVQQGGCIGEKHPVVLRYCMQKYLSGFICSGPTSISDAIFQTSTPVQYRWFNAYYNYVVRRLRDI
jgi:hypothetical protein